MGRMEKRQIINGNFSFENQQVIHYFSKSKLISGVSTNIPVMPLQMLCWVFYIIFNYTANMNLNGLIDPMLLICFMFLLI